jgi:hypothetical protein
MLFARIPPQPFVPFIPDLLATFVGLFFFVALIVFLTALLPFAVIITLGERCRIDSVTYYVGCGAVTGAAVIVGFIARDAQSLPYLLSIGLICLAPKVTSPSAARSAVSCIGRCPGGTPARV